MDDFKRGVLRICVRFLKEHGIYNIFIRNLRGKGSIDEYVICLLDHSCLSSFIVSGFIWDDTDEGHKFWSHMSQEWVSYITSVPRIRDLFQYDYT